MCRRPMAPRTKFLLPLMLVAGVSAIALAQDRPESILPPGFGAPPPPSTSPPAASGGTTATVGPDEGSGVEISTSLDNQDIAPPAPLPPVEVPPGSRRNPALAGPFDPVAIGIGAEPWGASDGRMLEALLRRMRTPLASRWAHIALRNALLAHTPTPFAVNAVDWAAERSWLLLRMGEADGSRMLVSGVDVADFTPKMVQVAIQSALANGDPAALCPIQPQVQKLEPSIGPLVEAICASLSGSPETAAADIEQARRRGRLGGIDLSLADKLVGAGADTARAVTIEWNPVDRLNTWRFGLAAATGLVPPDRLLTGSSPQLRAWLARSPMLAVAVRLPAARDAAALGVFSAQSLTDLYALAYDATDPDDLGASDAWQVRQAYVGKDVETRLAAMRKLWGAAKGDLDRMSAQLLVARAATLVAPDAGLQGDAPQLIAALLAAGFDRQAARWSGAVASMDDGPGDQCFAMLALGAPDRAGPPIDYGRLVDFAKRDTSENHHRTALLVGGLVGLGRLDGTSAGKLDARFDLGLTRQTDYTKFVDGASRRRQGGTVLVLAATGLQSAGFGGVPPIFVYHAINALHRTGQDFTARMIAAEALART